MVYQKIKIELSEILGSESNRITIRFSTTVGSGHIFLTELLTNSLINKLDGGLIYVWH